MGDRRREKTVRPWSHDSDAERPRCKGPSKKSGVLERLFFFYNLFRKILSNVLVAERFQKMDHYLGTNDYGTKI
jgi:hypothetical protein